MPKYVVSSKLDEGAWNNTTVLRGDEVAALKDDLDGDVLVLASFGLLRTLMADDLVDEMRLKVFPIVLGSGARLFGESKDAKPLRLVETNALGDEIAFLRYQRQV
jgi:dihydrofolate reductase